MFHTLYNHRNHLSWMLIGCMLLSFSADARDLPRQAKWQAAFDVTNTPGVTIRNIDKDSPLNNAGLKSGDTLLSVNDQAITNNIVWQSISASLVGNTPYTISYRRGLEQHSVEVELAPVAREQHQHLHTIHTSLVSDYGIRQQVIITHPKDMPEGQRMPALLMLTGLSCSSLELTPDRDHNWAKTIRALVTETNMVVLRVEKPGVGDSEGDCGKTDFVTELNGYEQAVKLLKSLPYVDPNKLIIYGSSMGSAIAPYLAVKFQASGVIADGTFFRSWFEHMLEIERRILQMQGKSQTEITRLMTQAYIPLYYGMLIEQKSYAEVVTTYPLLKAHNYHGDEHMYGRPVSYYHQLQQFDFAGYWQELKVPVRIRWGTNDWIMSEYDNDMIADTLKKAGNENVVLKKYPKLDHWSTLHDSAKDSFDGKPGQWHPQIAMGLVDWVKELAAIEPDAKTRQQ